MQQTLKVQVFTPVKKLLDTTASHLVIPTENGEIGVLPSHTALVCEVGYGVLCLDQDNKRRYFAIESGFCRINNDTVVILADSAEEAEAIDVARAKHALERAQERRKNGKAGEIVDFNRVEKAERRAFARLDAATRLSAATHNQ